jgi:hypothetical protein
MYLLLFLKETSAGQIFNVTGLTVRERERERERNRVVDLIVQGT